MRYFVRRILFFLLTLWAAITLNFIIPRLQPGDPAEAIARKIAGQNQPVDPAQIAAVRAMLGTPEGNMFQQYIEYLGHLVRGEFGVSSFYFPYTVIDMIGQAILWTVALAGVTQILGFVIGTLLGAFAAWKRNSIFDSVVSLGLTFLGTLPFFGIAILLTAPIGWVMGMRNNMIQTLGEDYTRLALAKGLSPWKVALRYCARNAIM